MSQESLYDEVPYPGRAFPQTHPDRLATMATLFGLDAAAPGACRVLELGCGDGGNLLPMALALPGSSFVGIDLAPQAIARARSIAAELGLDNIRFEQMGIEDYEPPPTSFDYVIAHGVYSWVGESVRDRLLAVCAEALSERGVAYVSYNALPGGRMRQTLRDMLDHQLDGIQEPVERMAAARTLLAQALAVWRPGEDELSTLGGQARLLLAAGDALFFHDTLSPVNKLVYFHEFAAHAGAHGLQFLAEAEFSEMQTKALPEDLQQRLLAEDDVVRREQLLDFLKQRMFRQTLLCHAAVTIDRPPRHQRLTGLAAAGSIEFETDTDSGRVTFTGTAGSRLETDHPLLIDVLERIAAHWPGAIWVTDLAGGEDAPEEALEVVCQALLPCFAANLVRLHAHPPKLCTGPGRIPRASPLVRLQARAREHLTTARHTSIKLEDDFGYLLITLLDGTRDRAALLAELEAQIGGEYPDLAGDLDRSLDTLARTGLLQPEA